MLAADPGADTGEVCLSKGGSDTSYIQCLFYILDQLVDLAYRSSRGWVDCGEGRKADAEQGGMCSLVIMVADHGADTREGCEAEEGTDEACLQRHVDVLHQLARLDYGCSKALFACEQGRKADAEQGGMCSLVNMAADNGGEEKEE